MVPSDLRRAIHLPHPAHAKLRGDFIRAEACAGSHAHRTAGGCTLQVEKAAAGRRYNVRMSVTDAFRTTLDLFETGVALMRQTIRRQDPSASEADVERRVRAWLRHRPGAEDGDGAGPPVTPGARTP